MRHFDLAIVGSGFGGAIFAMVARRLGKSVVLIERGSHPRFAIGESTSPLMNLLIEEIAEQFDLPRLLPLATYGAWKRAYPELGVGLKRGFTYYGHQPNQRFTNCADRRDQLSVAASPGDACADTHWLRADVDAFLKDEAVALGARYWEKTDIEQLERGASRWSLTLSNGEAIEADFLIDATGPNGCLHQKLGLRSVGFCGYPETRSVYSHFSGVKKCDDLADFATNGQQTISPYPRDASATHHVFPGGWMWVLPFDNGITSAGFAMTKDAWEEYRLGEESATAWTRFLAIFPSVKAQFSDAAPTQGWHHSKKLSFRTERLIGDGWAMLPSAVGFIDPLFSTGMPLTLLGVQRLSKLWEPGFDFAAYEQTTFEELDWTAEFIAAHYKSFGSFEHFSALTQYYFAAASYAELLRRLKKHDTNFRFLSANDPKFRLGLARCINNFELPKLQFFEAIQADIAHKNVAGLADLNKQNAYGVDLNDVVHAADKFGLTEDQMRAVIATADWARCS
jgi:tetracycline 7-halogenase / FADH2 O2-dependent halogenase